MENAVWRNKKNGIIDITVDVHFVALIGCSQMAEMSAEGIGIGCVRKDGFVDWGGGRIRSFGMLTFEILIVLCRFVVV